MPRRRQSLLRLRSLLQEQTTDLILTSEFVNRRGILMDAPFFNFVTNALYSMLFSDSVMSIRRIFPRIRRSTRSENSMTSRSE